MVKIRKITLCDEYSINHIMMNIAVPKNLAHAKKGIDR